MTKKVYKRTCLNKECKKKFIPFQNGQGVCSVSCSYKYANQQREKKEKQDKKDHNKWKKQENEKLKTRTDYLKEVQTVFNKWIRLRDKGLNCISCNNPSKKENAGHYRSVGGNPEMRFNELNCNLQCEYCNTFLHGNLINYRINLIKKIGIKEVEFLEQQHPSKHYSIPELITMKQVYKEKIRKLKL